MGIAWIGGSIFPIKSPSGLELMKSWIQWLVVLTGAELAGIRSYYKAMARKISEIMGQGRK